MQTRDRHLRLPASAIAPCERASSLSEAPVSIHLRGVGQTFAGARTREAFVALDAIDLDVHRHEFLGVIGPSGCGKSTLLRLIAGLLQPTEGRVEIFGLPVSRPRDDVGLVFQRPTLLPWLTVLDNVTFPARHQRGRVSSAERRKGLDLLEMVGLEDFAHRRPPQLSGGMQQRVGIARALFQDPDILLMDEPFSALDALTRDEMSIELLRILTARPKTVVFVTHSIQEALLLSDRIAIMASRPGRITEIKTTNLPRPRSLDTLTDPNFSRMADDIRRHVFSKRKVTE
ncbi:ABC transporter ATP-binding protein [Celeribacter indicus]|uniref:Nitrate/sulfonate/bicarbonate ABC transporter ATPase n=1 Tax=Celeribacter indicus TaxID=1208324 RepID=A0A0B5E0K5_9RHOB|nr:ABC transporter ATP-binding protein [Celeribacter indicus]AJE48789.1 nitrate/sulfonate/bicarbonate ABC transporter ATPase [Celeribacter indicus]SDX59694.1 NitT/TauT family transport system ATP-binding protein [Celeribacter indicus]